jgi:hypothetical protein
VVQQRFGTAEALRRLQRGTLLKRRAADDGEEWEFLVVEKSTTHQQEEEMRLGARKTGKTDDNNLRGIKKSSDFAELFDDAVNPFVTIVFCKCLLLKGFQKMH